MGLSYKHFLYGAVTFTSLLAAMLRIGVLGASVSPPMAFYFGVLYFAFIAWAAGQLWKIHSQQQQSELPENGGMDVPLAEDDRPSEETLFAAKAYLSMGENLDTVCMFVNPKYRDWDSSRKLAFRQGLNTLLSEHGGEEYPKGKNDVLST
jgi:hypothetical protein